MGTRSLTHIRDEADKTICTIYRQFDGGPGEHGVDILKVVDSGKLVNGYTGNGSEQFNGTGCFAAQLICALKKGEESCAGNIYIFAPDSTDCGEEFVYTVRPWAGRLMVQVDQMEGAGFEDLREVLARE